VSGAAIIGRRAAPPASEAHREGLVEDVQEHFDPKVHAASVVEIIEVAETDNPVAQANLHHPFAVPPIPCDAGKAGPVGLGHGCTSMLHWEDVEAGSAGPARRLAKPIHAVLSLSLTRRAE
jgi:hypothetical protein